MRSYEPGSLVDPIESFRVVVAAMALAVLGPALPAGAGPARSAPEAVVISFQSGAPASGGGARAGAKQPRAGDVLARGQILWTGESGRATVLVDGHSLLTLGPATALAVLPASVEPGAGGRRVDVVKLYGGTVTLGCDPRHVPAGTRVALLAGERVQTTAGGWLEATLPPVARGSGGLDPEAALSDSTRPLPFGEALYAASDRGQPLTVGDGSRRARLLAELKARRARPAPPETGRARTARVPGSAGGLDLEYEAARQQALENRDQAWLDEIQAFRKRASATRREQGPDRRKGGEGR